MTESAHHKDTANEYEEELVVGQDRKAADQRTEGQAAGVAHECLPDRCCTKGSHPSAGDADRHDREPASWERDEVRAGSPRRGADEVCEQPKRGAAVITGPMARSSPSVRLTALAVPTTTKAEQDVERTELDQVRRS